MSTYFGALDKFRLDDKIHDFLDKELEDAFQRINLFP